MKKIFSLLVLLSLLSFSVFAESPIQTVTFFNASGSTSDSEVIPATATAPGSGNRVIIDSIYALGDVAGAALKIYVGDGAGVTTSFTQVAQYDIGDASVSLPSACGSPLFVGSANYQYKVEVGTTTTANSCIVNFHVSPIGEN